MRWLPEPSQAAVADALRVVAPELAGLPVTIPSPAGGDDPVYHQTSAALGEDYIVKFAWSQAAARFVRHQISVLATLAAEPAVPYLPEVVAARTSPLILVTRRVPGTSLFKTVDRIDPDHAGGQLARFLAALHSDQTRRRAEAAIGPVQDVRSTRYAFRKPITAHAAMAASSAGVCAAAATSVVTTRDRLSRMRAT